MNSKNPRESAPTLEAAVSRLLELRREHAPILQKILADPGMAAATRELLVTHLQEEEDQKLAVIAQLSAATAQSLQNGGSTAGASPAGATGAALTVGALLRLDPAPASHGSGTVGTLRRG